MRFCRRLFATLFAFSVCTPLIAQQPPSLKITFDEPHIKDELTYPYPPDAQVNGDRRQQLSIITSQVPISAQSPDRLTSLVMSVEAYPSHGLPGIPPSLKVTLVNTGNDTLVLPDAAVCVRGVGEDGSVFASGCNRSGRVQIGSDVRRLLFAPNSHDVQRLTIAAKHDVVLFLPSELNKFFYTQPLLRPGRYDLTLELNSGDVRSNAVRYVVDLPSGEDASVWQELLVRHSGTDLDDLPFLDPALVSAFTEHPTSAYAKIYRQYRFLISPPGGESAQVEWLANEVALGLPASFDVIARARLAGAYDAWAKSLARAGNIDQAVEEASRGAAILKTLGAEKDSFAAAIADAYLQEGAWDRGQLLQVVDSQTPKKMLPINPHADCVVRNADGTYTAWFGYSNKNSGVYGFPVGSDNRFSPEPMDRGQVTTFLIGDRDRVFSVVVPAGEKLTWILNGKPAVANAVGDRANCDNAVPTAK